MLGPRIPQKPGWEAGGLKPLPTGLRANDRGGTCVWRAPPHIPHPHIPHFPTSPLPTPYSPLAHSPPHSPLPTLRCPLSTPSCPLSTPLLHSWSCSSPFHLPVAPLYPPRNTFARTSHRAPQSGRSGHGTPLSLQKLRFQCAKRYLAYGMERKKPVPLRHLRNHHALTASTTSLRIAPLGQRRRQRR